MNEDLKLLYEQYKQAGNSETEEQFLEAKQQLGDEAFLNYVNTQIDLKKKDQPTENGTPSLTTTTPPSQTDLPPMPNPIPENEFMVPMGSEQDLSSASSGITAETLSTDLPLTDVVSSGTESLPTNPPITGNAIPTLDNAGNIPMPANEISEPNPLAKNGKRAILSFDELDPVSKLGGTGDVVQQNENTELNLDYISGDKDSAGNAITKDQQRVMYQDWETKGYGKLYERGEELVFAANSEGKKAISPLYQNKTTEEIKTPEKTVNPFTEFLDELSLYGAVPTDEEREQMSDEVYREEYLLSTQAAYWAKQNGTTLQEEYDRLNEGANVTDAEKTNLALNIINVFEEGIERGGLSSEDISAERKYYEQIKNDPALLADFGDYVAKSELSNPSFIKERSFTYQRKRKATIDEYIQSRFEKEQATLQFTEDAIKSSEAKLNKFQSENNVDAYNQELAKYNGYQEKYKTSAGRLKQIQDNATAIQPIFGNVNKENQNRENFTLKVENNEVLANTANIAAQIPLVIGQKVQSLLGGIGRIANTVIDSDNLRDALDSMATEELSVGNVKSAGIANRVEYLKDSKGNSYKDINGTLYAYRNGKISRLKENIDRTALTSQSKDTEYNVSGVINMTTGLLVDALFTKGVMSGFTKGAKYSAMLSNSKKVNEVFGVGSQMAKGAAGLANVMKNPASANVAYWFTQFSQDSYIAAKEGGIESEAGRNLYMVSQSIGLALISQINPDINILKAIGSSNRTLVNALLKNDMSTAQKAFGTILDYGKKVGVNVGKEVPEEGLQQGYQDLSAFIVNSIGDKNIRVAEVQDYKELAVGTVGSVALAAVFGGRANVKIGGKEINANQLTQPEILTLLAREPKGLEQLKEAKEDAYFESQRNMVDLLIEDVSTRKKYLDKIPEIEKYNPESLAEVAPILQDIEVERAKLKEDDGTFAERINGKIATLTAEVNAILDNDLTPNTENAETPPTAPSPETVQEQDSTGSNEPEQTAVQQTPQIAPIEPNGNVGAESGVTLNTEPNGQTPAEIASPSAETEENGQASQEEGRDAANQLPEMGEGNPEPEQVTQTVAPEEEIKPISQLGTGANVYFETEKHRLNDNNYDGEPYILNIGEKDNTFPRGSVDFNDLKEAKFVAERVAKDFPQGMPDAILFDKYISGIRDEYSQKQTPSQAEEEINEDDIDISDIDVDALFAQLEENERTQTDNTGTDGNPESATGIIQQSEPTGQENPQTVSPTADTGTGEGNAEVEIPTSNPNLSVKKTLNPTTGSSSFEFIDTKTGKVKKVDKKTEQKHLTDIVKNTTYPETAVPEGVENDNDLRQVILQDSKNPMEIANVLMTMPKFQDLKGTKEWHIANNITRVSRQSFIDNSDKNNITIGLARAYFAEKGKETNEMKIDVIARTASDAYKGGQDGNNAITTEDVVRFMLEHRTGKDSFYRKKNPDYTSAVNRFVELTGMNPTPKVLKDVMGLNTENDDAEQRAKVAAEKAYETLSAERQNNLANEYNEWFNSLSLEDKATELLNSYPYDYEQNTTAGNQGNENQSQSANSEGQSGTDATTESVAEQGEKNQLGKVISDKNGTTWYEINKPSVIKDDADKWFLIKGIDGNEIYRSNNRIDYDLEGNKLPFGSADKLMSDNKIIYDNNHKVELTKKSLKEMVLEDKRILSSKTIDEISKSKNISDLKDLLSDKETYKIINSTVDAEKEINKRIQYLQRKPDKQEVEFQSTDKTFTPIPQTTYDKLVKRLLGVFKKFGGKVITDKKEFAEKLKGASNIDLSIFGTRANLSEVEQNNLALAFSDFKNGVDPKLIALTRSWFKGKDGKWKRVTETDLQIKDNSDFSIGEKSLGDLVEFEELFKLYPDIQNLKVIIENEPERDYYAKYSSQDEVITINNATRKDGEFMRRQLLHELQHHIQNIEGFAGGTNTLKEQLRVLGIAGKTFGEESLTKEENELAKQLSQEFGENLAFDSLNDDKLKSFGEFLYTNNIGELESMVAERLDFSKDIRIRSEFAFSVIGEVSNTEFMKTKDGEIYGAKFPDGTIYLNPEKVNANTPIHEFSHLWQQLMPARFKKGVELLKNTPIGKRTFADLKANDGYANKSDEELWNEAMVTVMGNEGERIFNAPRASKLKEWLTDLFKALGNAFGIRDLSPNDKLSTFVKGALSEVMGTKEIIPESNVEQKEVPIYIKKMSNVDLRAMLNDFGLIEDAVCA